MRLIDADELAKKIAGHSNYHGDSILAAIYCMAEGKQVGNVRPIDAEPVVRCKDCDKAKTNIFAEESHVVYCINHGMSKQYDDFCSYGERKDGE